MKKPALLLTSALLLSLALTACGGESAPAESAVPSAPPAESVSPAASAAPMESTAPAESAAPQDDGAVLYTPGSYTGTADGYNGPITVTVVVTTDRIESITVDSHSDSENIIQKASDHIAPAIIEANSTDVEPISGATLTSDGYKGAVRAALAQASAG